MDKPDAPAIVDANRRFYDQIASVYDQVDRRRRQAANRQIWIDQVLARLAGLLDGPPETRHLLDAGTGSGFLAYRAQRWFPRLTLVDVSARMLERIALPGAVKLCASVDHMPVADGSVDCVGAFATLHHLFDPRTFFAEARRVLRPGGVLYTDHDIERAFVARFAGPLRLYRRVFDHGHGYLQSCPDASARDYHLSEFHGDDGLPADDLAGALEGLGFAVLAVEYHWQGMGLPARLVAGLGLEGRLSRRSLAPVFRLIARRL